MTCWTTFRIASILTRPPRASQQRPLPRRFYKDVTLGEAEDGFRILLDGRPVRTPARAIFAVPSRELGEAVADEWRRQEKEINPHLMPLTPPHQCGAGRGRPRSGGLRRRNRALCRDRPHLLPRPKARSGLVARQGEMWDPVLDWLRQDHGARFVLSAGIVHVAQPEESLARIDALVPRDALRLTALGLPHQPPRFGPAVTRAVSWARDTGRGVARLRMWTKTGTSSSGARTTLPPDAVRRGRWRCRRRADHPAPAGLTMLSQAELDDLFCAFGPVRTRPMFGGGGLYADGLMFAIDVDDCIFLKADRQPCRGTRKARVPALRLSGAGTGSEAEFLERAGGRPGRAGGHGAPRACRPCLRPARGRGKKPAAARLGHPVPISHPADGRGDDLPAEMPPAGLAGLSRP